MPSNPSLYRYIDFIGGNILDASNVTLLQTILEGRSVSAVNGITGMAQLFAQGTLLNCVFNITGSTIIMTHANASYPIFVLVNDRFESLGSTVTIAGSQPGSGVVNLYLNWAWNQVTSAVDPSFIDGITGEPTIQAGQLALDVDWADTHGSPSPTQFAINSSPIVLAIFNMSATPNVTVTYINGVLPYAQGNPNQAGLVALTDNTGLAVGTTDARTHDSRVPAPVSVNTESIAALIQTGLQVSSYPAWVAGLAAPGAKVVDSNGNLQICSTTQTGPGLISPYLPANIPATLVTDLIAVGAGPTYTLGGWNTNVGGVTWQAISNNPPISSVEWIWINAGPANLPAYDPTAFVTFSLSSVSVAGSVVTYNGAITGSIGTESVSGAGNFFAGYRFTVAGFTNIGNNGIELLCTASSATTLVLTNPYAVNEVTAATATLNQGGISSDLLIYSTKQETVTAALNTLFAASGGSAGVVSFNGRFGIVVSQAGDYTASQVGAAPASHVGLELGLPASHPASVTSNISGFTVNEGLGALSGDAFALLDSSSTRKAALTHTGDIYALLANAANAQGGGPGGGGGTATYKGTLGLLSLIGNVLAEHVNYTAPGTNIRGNNPHGLSAGDVGAATEAYVDTQVSDIVADVTAYTDAKINISVRTVTTTGAAGITNSAWDWGGVQPSNNTATYFIVDIGGGFELAIGLGQYQHGNQMALPEVSGWSSSNWLGLASCLAMTATEQGGGAGMRTIVAINPSTRIVTAQAYDSSDRHSYPCWASVIAIAWRFITAPTIIISSYDTAANTFDAGHVGDTVIVTGRNFGSSRGTTTVSFNGVPAISYPTWSSTSFSVVVPALSTSGAITIHSGVTLLATSPFVFTIS